MINMKLMTKEICLTMFSVAQITHICRFKLILAIFPIFFIFPGCFNTSKSAPDGSYFVRNLWGRIYLSGMHSKLAPWVGTIPVVNENIGNVRRIAPIQGPNYQIITIDTYDVVMTLEVQGERGSGILFIPGYTGGIYGYGKWKGYPHLSKGITWEFENNKKFLFPNGEEYFDHLGLTEIYNNLLLADKENKPKQVVTLFRTFEPSFLKDPMAISHVNESSGFLPYLIWPYKRQVMPIIGKAFVQLGDKNKGTEILNDCLRFAVGNAMDNLSPYRLDTAKAEVNLETAYDVVSLLASLDSILEPSRLIIQRVELVQFIKQQVAYRVRYDSTNRDRATWAKAILGQYFDEAIQWPLQASRVTKDVGKILSVELDPRFRSGFRVGRLNWSDNWIYFVHVGLVIAGERGTGKLVMRFFEDPTKVPSIDLYDRNPRGLSVPFRYSMPSWKMEGKQSLKLWPKDGSPYNRN